MVEKGYAFLKSHQRRDGSWSTGRPAPASPPWSSPPCCATATAPTTPSSPRPSQYLEKSVKKDGGIYNKGLANYTTSVA